MNRNMSRPRNREQRTKPPRDDMGNHTLHLSRRAHERMKELLRKFKCDREDIFRIGMEQLDA